MVIATGHWFDDLAVGASFATTLTITETHLVTGAGLIGDFNPLHMDENFARASRYGSRILHGALTAAVMGGPIGMIFHGTAIAYLEQATRFLAPVRIGDTLCTTWTVSELVPKPQHGPASWRLVLPPSTRMAPSSPKAAERCWWRTRR